MESKRRKQTKPIIVVCYTLPSHIKYLEITSCVEIIECLATKYITTIYVNLL